MRAFLIMALFLCVRALNAAPAPALLELFTSQGCSSCPPADALLTRLAAEQPLKGVEIIPLAFHVDYWNGLGWTDPFARAGFTARQYSYARALGADNVFTPQAVADGYVSAVGSDEKSVLKGLLPLRRLDLKWQKSGLLISGLDAQLQLWIAVTENGLSTAVGRGENSGRTLTQSAVVRIIRHVPIQNVKGGRVRVAVALNSAWKLPALHLVAFQAAGEGLPVLAAGQTVLMP